MATITCSSRPRVPTCPTRPAGSRQPTARDSTSATRHFLLPIFLTHPSFPRPNHAHAQHRLHPNRTTSANGQAPLIDHQPTHRSLPGGVAKNLLELDPEISIITGTVHLYMPLPLRMPPPRITETPIPLSDYLFPKSTVINEIYGAGKLEKPHTPTEARAGTRYWQNVQPVDQPLIAHSS